MERINRIIRHPKYAEYLQQIARQERNRIYCRHTIEHFLDVARIAYILALEESLGISKAQIYAAALLHDIGRFLEYTENIPHETASATLAEEILIAAEFLPSETTVILNAIQNHRNFAVEGQANLQGLLYRADHLSRACFQCSGESSCNWRAEQKNLKLQY